MILYHITWGYYISTGKDEMVIKKGNMHLCFISLTMDNYFVKVSLFLSKQGPPNVSVWSVSPLYINALMYYYNKLIVVSCKRLY